MTTYEPKMMQALRLKTTQRALWMIYAQDGTILDAIDTSDGIRPGWADKAIRAGEMCQLPTIDIMPSDWRKWREYAAARVTTDA